MGKKKSGKKKSGKKGGKKGSKKKSANGDKEDGPLDHGGYNPMGEPIRVYCVDREPVPKDIPENEALLAERGREPDEQPAKIIRIGEFHMSPCSDLKRRIHEVTGIPISRIHLFCRAPQSDGGRPVQEVYGWKNSWPWPQDMLLVNLEDDLPLSAYKITIKSPERLAKERADHAALMKALEDDPELRKEHQKKKLLQKEALEAAKASKKKSGKKSKKKGGSKKGGKGKGLSEKEQAIHDRKEAEKKAKQEAALREERDKVREWPENQLFMILKPDGMADQPAFTPSGSQPTEEHPPRNFLVRLPTPRPQSNSHTQLGLS
eukprot:m.290039 g.290039  ORF g.290039 m.290039 type:complete len:319 (+) comp19974_c2_seq9:271-1227(+)